MEVLNEPRIVRHRLSVEQYHRMGEAGVFEPDARVELIEGEVIDMAPMGTRHFAAVSRLHRTLTLAVGDRALVNAQLPLRLGAMSEPEPDISVLQPRADYYAAALPTGADALLVIEVADSTLAFDLHTKAHLYASHGVIAYWVFDLPNALLHVHGAPQGEAYGNVTALRQPGSLPIPGLPGLAVDLTGLL